MKNVRFFAILCLLAVYVFVSCRKEPELSVSSKEIIFDAMPVNDTVNIKSNVSWTVFLNQEEEWFTVEPMEGENNGEIVISAQYNPHFDTDKKRNAQIEIIGVGVSPIKILIEQDVEFDIAPYITNKVFRDTCLARFDNDPKDGKISMLEVSRVDEIKVDRLSLKSLEGIEYFTKLTHLDCSVNEIETLDLSKNTRLKSLDCSVNRLERLDLTNNKELVYLTCTNSPVSRLDITGLTNLKDATIFWLQLESIDVSTNTSLEWLFLTGNKISRLDVSNNLKLNNLYCNNCALENLDVSINTKLWTLECAENNLKALNISANTELIYFTCGGNQLSDPNIVKNNNVLVKFTCNDNRFTSLDLSNNVKLDIFECNTNQISNLNLSNNVNMTTLKCSGNRLSGSIDISNLNPQKNIKVDLTGNTDLKTIYVREQLFINNAIQNPEHFQKDNNAEWVVKGN